MKKVIIINGQGGVGKDTLIGFVAENYKTSMISSITPVKEVAARAGWEGEKDLKSRRFLSELKKLMTQYNDAPLFYCKSMLDGFLKTDEEILFVQIREPKEICRFEQCCEECGIHAYTLLIRNSRISKEYGNSSDDGVENYDYDFTYDNDLQLMQAKDDFMNFFKSSIIDG